MARPFKWRRIEQLPAVTLFVPSDGPSAGPENVLKLEELEAVRLKDLEGLEQSECADKMGVSRQTFQRILQSARVKLADSLINGKAVHIVGGHFTQNVCLVRCLDCGREWTESLENMAADQDLPHGFACPACRSGNTQCDQSCAAPPGRGGCRHHGRHQHGNHHGNHHGNPET